MRVLSFSTRISSSTTFDVAEPAKRARSRALIESLPAEAVVLSAQVVNEVCVGKRGLLSTGRYSVPEA